MSQVTINGQTVLKLELELPLWGTWWANVEVDATDLSTGLATLVVAGTQFNGTIREASAFAGRVRAKVYGGADKLQTVMEPKHYGASTPAGLPLADIAVEVGEALAEGVRSKLDTITLQSFHRAQAPARRLLSNLCRVLGDGYNWRIRGDGTIWLGKETWDSFGNKLPLKLNGPDQNGLATYAPADAALQPGVNLDGKRVSKVRYTLGHGPPGLRAEVYLLRDATTTADRHREQHFNAVRSAIPELEWLEQHEAEVIEQKGDGRIDVTCDDPRIGDVTDLEIFLGLPGAKVEVDPGARVIVCFSEARPDKAFAMLFGAGSKASKITIEADEIYLGDGQGRVLRDGDTVIAPDMGAPGPITLAPTNVQPGPPGAGYSKVFG